MKKTVSADSSRLKYGKKKEGETPSKSYALYDTCDACPLRVYIELVCKDNLKALVKEGEAPDDVLEVAMGALIMEFSELSGNSHSSAVSNARREFYLHKSQIMGLDLCLRLFQAGEFEEALAYLNKNGVRAKAPTSDKEMDVVIKKVTSLAKNKAIRLKEALSRYQKLSEKKGSKPTEQEFNDQLVILSKHAGFRLTKDITLAEYAGYLKDYQKSVDHGERYKK